jgi:hypothetical protein
MASQVDALPCLTISLWMRGAVLGVDARMSRWWKVDSGVRSALKSRHALPPPLPGILLSQSGNIPAAVQRS